MEDWQKELILDQKEKNFKPKKLEFFFLRHGESVYKEELGPNSHQETGVWDQALVDLTDKGIAEATKAGKFILSAIDPNSHALVYFSSPRARDIATLRIVEKELKNKNFEIISSKGKFQPIYIAQILRSGGDFSPLYNEKTNSNIPAIEKTNALTDQEYYNKLHKSTGLRFNQFLNFIIRKYSQEFPSSKTPVFIVATHNEVLSIFLEHLRIIPDYVEAAGIIPAGSFFKIEVNTATPQELAVSFPDPSWHFKSTKFSSAAISAGLAE